MTRIETKQRESFHIRHFLFTLEDRHYCELRRMSFAYVQYTYDKTQAKVPISFIKRFDFEAFKVESSKTKTYRVYWSKELLSLQNDEDKLQNMPKPPHKQFFNVEEGESYYDACVLRVEASLKDLNESLKKKRPIFPTCLIGESNSTTTTEDEGGIITGKDLRKKQEAEKKKKEQESRRLKGRNVLKAAKTARKETFINMTSENDDDDSDEDPSLIPVVQYRSLQQAYEYLERKMDALEIKYKALEQETVDLRNLNRQLQEELLKGKRYEVERVEQETSRNELETGSDSEEVDLGANIKVSKKLLREVFLEPTLRKFTKSIGVHIWSSKVLATRSVTGRQCRNKNGPKKKQEEEQSGVTEKLQQAASEEAKPPLTPAKLAVVSEQMRLYMQKQNKSAKEIEEGLKLRNRFLSDKIQDICRMKNVL